MSKKNSIDRLIELRSELEANLDKLLKLSPGANIDPVIDMIEKINALILQHIGYKDEDNDADDETATSS